jgi:hypothetical protein
MARPMTEAISQRYEFTEHERGDLGAELAQIYQEKAKLDEDRKSMAAQLKEREAGMENRIGTLSRQITAGFEMRTYDCTLRWDSPNIGEVSFYRQDNGVLVKTRAMTVAERQMDLPLQTEEQTKNNVVSFFKKGGEVVEGGKEGEEGQQGSDAPPETEQPQGEAVAPPQTLPDPPPDWQGSLEEYHAHLASSPAPEPPRPSGPTLPARGKRPKKTVDTPQESTVQ